jgi:hypothetical protein
MICYNKHASSPQERNILRTKKMYDISEKEENKNMIPEESNAPS